MTLEQAGTRHWFHSRDFLSDGDIRRAPRSGAHDGNRGTGVQHAVQSHRTQQTAGHRVMAVVADHQQVGVAGRVAQHLPGLSCQGLNGDRPAADAAFSCRDEVVDVLLDRLPDVLDEDLGRWWDEARHRGDPVGG